MIACDGGAPARIVGEGRPAYSPRRRSTSWGPTRWTETNGRPRTIGGQIGEWICLIAGLSLADRTWCLRC